MSHLSHEYQEKMFLLIYNLNHATDEIQFSIFEIHVSFEEHLLLCTVIIDNGNIDNNSAGNSQLGSKSERLKTIYKILMS